MTANVTNAAKVVHIQINKFRLNVRLNVVIISFINTKVNLLFVHNFVLNTTCGKLTTKS